MCLNSFASSAYRKMLLTSPQTSGKSLMKIINNSGPGMLPCGIPLITFIHDKNLLLILTLKLLNYTTQNYAVEYTPQNYTIKSMTKYTKRSEEQHY